MPHPLHAFIGIADQTSLPCGLVGSSSLLTLDPLILSSARRVAISDHILHPWPDEMSYLGCKVIWDVLARDMMELAIFAKGALSHGVAVT